MRGEEEYDYNTSYGGRYRDECPGCGQSGTADVDGTPEFDDGFHFIDVPMRCGACGTTWTYEYAYCSFTHVKVPGREAL